MIYWNSNNTCVRQDTYAQSIKKSLTAYILEIFIAITLKLWNTFLSKDGECVREPGRGGRHKMRALVHEPRPTSLIVLASSPDQPAGVARPRRCGPRSAPGRSSAARPPSLRLRSAQGAEATLRAHQPSPAHPPTLWGYKTVGGESHTTPWSAAWHSWHALPKHGQTSAPSVHWHCWCKIWH